MTLQRESKYDSLKPIEKLEAFTAFCRSVLERYNGNVRAQSDAEQQETDIMHFVEMSNTLKATDAYKAYAKLRDTLRVRRDAKNENDLLAPLYEILMNNPDIMKNLDKALGKVRTAKEVIDKRKYTSRTDILEEKENA